MQKKHETIAAYLRMPVLLVSNDSCYVISIAYYNDCTNRK